MSELRDNAIAKMIVRFTKRQINNFFEKLFSKKNVCIIAKIPEYIMVFLIPTLYYYFNICVLRKNVVGESSWLRDVIEIPITIFGFINVIGNMILNSFTDTSLKRYMSRITEEKAKPNHNEPGSGENLSLGCKGCTYCYKCKMYQVERSWHCKKCDICIVDRDYHCAVLSQCVGRYTKRYYILTCIYVILSLCYSIYYTINYDCGETSLNALDNNPYIRYLWFFFFIIYMTRFSVGCFTKLFAIFMNTTLSLLCVIALGFNLYFGLKGVTAFESKYVKKSRVRVGKVRRFFQLFNEVLGLRWYLAILWPFASSPIPTPYIYQD